MSCPQHDIDELKAVPRPKRERRLPVVLSREEVQRLFAVVTNLKHKALLMVAYDAGLRLSEILNLRIEDIDSGRMVIGIRQSKGKKDRYARLSPRLLELLREYWRAYHPPTWLFPGACQRKRYNVATPGHILKKLCRKAGITKRVSMHTLALQNKREIYGILFRAAAQTLLELAADPKHLGAKIGCLMVLHTWGQNLMHHPHVHAIVTGGGLSADGSHWIHGK